MLGGHGVDKYTTGTRIQASAQDGARGLLAERWAHDSGDLGEAKPRDTEVIVLLSGDLRVRRRGDGRLQDAHAVPGTVWVCPAGVAEDMIRLYGEIRESIHLHLPAPLGAAAAAELDRAPEQLKLRYEGGFRDPVVEGIARSIASEMKAGGGLSGLRVETLASALGVHIMRSYSNVVPGAFPLPASKGALDARRLARVLDFIEARLGEPLRLGDIAREACLSPFHLARAFKAATGRPLHRHVADRRLDLAKASLARADRSIVDVALSCGFSSQAHLSSSFKRATGMSPGTFRHATSGLPVRRRPSGGVG